MYPKLPSAVLGGAARDHVRVATAGANPIGELVEPAVVADLPLERVEVEGGAHHVAQERVSDMPLLAPLRRDPVVVQEHASEAHSRSRGSRLAGLIGLHCSNRDEGVSTLLDGIGDDELELAGLVAAAGEAGEVVALDPDLGPAEVVREPAERVHRGRQARQLEARMARQTRGQLGNVHPYPWRSL